MQDEKTRFVEYIKINLNATVARGRQCQNFSTFYGESAELSRCLLNEYKDKNGELTITPEEAAQICPFFSPNTIETKCVYYGNYPLENNGNKTEEYLFGIASIIQIKLQHQNKKRKDLIEQQGLIMERHLGVPEPPPSVYENFVQWMKKIIEKIIA